MSKQKKEHITLQLLHAGCGRKTKQQLPILFHNGWQETRLDIDPQTKPDLIGSVTDLKEISSNSIDAVYSSHNLEHLYSHEVPIALKEFTRVLKSNGFVIITLPDLQQIAKLIVEDKLMEPAYQSGVGPISPIDMLYGHRASVASGNEFMSHKTGFTQRSLKQLLTNAGFADVRVAKDQHFNLWAIAAIEKQSDKFWTLMDKTIIVK
jgi:SAM-dependent methyltransferase